MTVVFAEGLEEVCMLGESLMSVTGFGVGEIVGSGVACSEGEIMRNSVVDEDSFVEGLFVG